MSDDPIQPLLQRIELALVRIEAVARAARPPLGANDSDARYRALRARTQAALESLETVIAHVGKGR